MHGSYHLERILCIKEDVKSVNKLSRKIYMLALNAMLMSRRADGTGTGYARVTRELRNFSESLEKAMEWLTQMSNSKHAEGFYRHWMGSNGAKKNWCNNVRELEIDMLCPQHGAIYRGDDVKRFIDWFDDLKVGINL